jgi:hypothetical protein
MVDAATFVWHPCVASVERGQGAKQCFGPRQSQNVLRGRSWAKKHDPAPQKLAWKKFQAAIGDALGPTPMNGIHPAACGLLMVNVPKESLAQRASLAVTVKGPKPYNNHQFMVLSPKKKWRRSVPVYMLKPYKVLWAPIKIAGGMGIASFACRNDVQPISLFDHWREGHFKSFPSAP